MLITASWVERVRKILGLQGVSQIWCESPAWYFWLADAPGPYELHLQDVNETAPGTDGVVTGLFSVRLFPRPSEWAFSSFSPEEQRLVSGDLFDETDTLRLEARDRVHPHLFTIATIGISLSVENEALGLFTLEAPEVSLWRVLKSQVGETVETQGTVARNVPAWHLARRLFDCLVSLHAFAADTRPARVLVTSAPGFEVVQGEGGTVAPIETPDGRLLAQSVVFGTLGPEGSALADFMDRERAGADCEVLLDWRADCMCHSRPPTDASTYVSENWWSIAGVERASHLGSTCGCH